MIRRLKLVGLASLAVMAVTAVAASAASAVEFHAENEPVNFEGSQTVKHVFTVNTGIVNCTTATFKGTNTTKTSTTATLVPTYKECRAFGVKADVEVNGCAYIFHPGSSGTPTTTVDVECPGTEIEVKPIGVDCTVSVPPQLGLGNLTLINEGAGAGRFLKAEINVTGIAYSEAGTECVGGAGETNGKYTGQATVSGFQDVGGANGAQQGIWVE